MLEDAQWQAGWAGRTIADNTLLLFLRIDMLTSERFPQANNEWEERAECDRTWSKWNTAYKRAHAKARVQAQANDGSVKFGAANSDACQEKPNSFLDNQLEEDGGDLNTLKGYFDNLAATAVNKKGFLHQLVSNNTTLSTSNESLVVLV